MLGSAMAVFQPISEGKVGATIGIIAGAAGAAARELEDTLEKFRVGDATAPDRAQSLDRLGLSPTLTVDRLARAGVILPGSTRDRVYLSEAAYAAYRRAKTSRAAIIVGAAMAIGILAAVAALLATQHASRLVR